MDRLAGLFATGGAHGIGRAAADIITAAAGDAACADMNGSAASRAGEGDRARFGVRVGGYLLERNPEALRNVVGQVEDAIRWSCPAGSPCGRPATYQGAADSRHERTTITIVEQKLTLALAIAA